MEQQLRQFHDSSAGACVRQALYTNWAALLGPDGRRLASLVCVNPTLFTRHPGLDPLNRLHEM